MPYLTQNVEDILDGVSQQPMNRRAASQASEQLNALSSVTHGLVKRPPLTHVAKLTGTSTGFDSSIQHIIDRSPTQRYRVIFLNGDVQVWDAAGISKTITFPNGKSYLATATPSKSIRAVTVGEKTYIVNREIPVTKGVALAPTGGAIKGLVCVLQGAPGKNYSITLTEGGTSAVGTYTLPAGTDSTSLANLATGKVAQALLVNLSSGDPTAIANGVAVPIGVKFWGQVLGSNLVFYTTDGGDFSIVVRDGVAGEGLLVVKGTINLQDRLPTADVPDGFPVTITGSTGTPLDDYYLHWDASKQAWVEQSKPGSVIELSPLTMPHCLTHDPVTGAFTFDQVTWDQRQAGDDTTCPFPSFVGQTLSNIFFHQGRLGVTAGESLVFSQAAKETNWFRQTVTDILANDPIDVRTSAHRSGAFQTHFEWNERLYLNSHVGQFVVTGEPALTPTTVRIDPITAFRVSPNCDPLVMGSRVFMAVDRNSFTEILEYTVQPNTFKPDGANVTKHVPTYLKGSVVAMAGDDGLGLLAVITDDGSQRYLYAYLYHLDGLSKDQASWSRWTLPAGSRLLGVDLMQTSQLGVVLKYPDAVYLSALNLDVDAVLADDHSLAVSALDRRITETTPGVNVLLDGNGDSNIVVPWPMTGGAVVIGDRDTGTAYNATQVSPTFFIVHGVDLRGKHLNIGITYEFFYQLSTIYFRSGPQQIADPRGRLQLSTVELWLYGSTNATVTVVPYGREAKNYTLANTLPFEGTMRIPVLCRNENTVINVWDASAGVVRISGYTWTGTLTRLGSSA